MHLVDNIHLIFSLRRRILHFFDQRTDIFYTIVGSRIHLNDIHRCLFLNSLTHCALSARAIRSRIFTVYCLCKNLRHSSFSRTSGAAEKVCVADTLALQFITKGLDNVVLPLYIGKILRPIFTI